MKERREIVQLWHEGEASVLVTLVRVQGSSYRRPGARLLLRKGGGYAGTISGGCLEAEVHRKAGWLLRHGPVLERYSTLFDDSADVPFGLGCGGVIDLLFEPADTAECQALLGALEDTLHGHKRIVCTLLPEGGRGLARVIFDAAANLLFASEAIPEGTVNYARECVIQGLAPEQDDLYFETLCSPPRLFVLGAGDDAKPVVSMAAQMGWHVTVMDGRSQLARNERFPHSHRVSVLSAEPAALKEIRGDDAVVVMTHSYEQDRDLLMSLLPCVPDTSDSWARAIAVRYSSRKLPASLALTWKIAAA